jgi:hypothetical protein
MNYEEAIFQPGGARTRPHFCNAHVGDVVAATDSHLIIGPAF